MKWGPSAWTTINRRPKTVFRPLIFKFQKMKFAEVHFDALSWISNKNTMKERHSSFFNLLGGHWTLFPRLRFTCKIQWKKRAKEILAPFFKICFSSCIFCFVCTNVCALCASPPLEARRGCHIPWKWVTEGCELPCGCWKLNLGPLEQPVFLIAELALRPLTFLEWLVCLL